MRADRHDAKGYRVVPFPFLRVPVLDSPRAARRKPLMHALVEFDITTPRASLRDHKRRTGEALLFTAFIIGCVAHAAARHEGAQAYRRGTRRLVLFYSTAWTCARSSNRIARPG